LSSFDQKLPNDLKRIWETSKQVSTPTGPSTADAWMRLEQRLDMKDPVPALVQHRKVYFPIQPRLAYAFALMIIALLSGPKIYDMATHTTVSAERGGQAEINLADGSSVKLNSESSLKYKRNFNSESRIVNLNGEGYFEVVKGDYPFTVETLYGTVTVLGTKFNVHEIAPIIRGLLSENKDQKFVVNYRLNKHLKYFINGKNVRSYSSKGTATPDHVIRVKPFPLVITPKKNSSIEEFKTTAKKAFESYRKKYIHYFNVNKKKTKGKKVMLDTSPRVVLVQNVGMFSIGKDLNGARIAGDLTETNAKVIGSVEETSTYKFIPEKDLFDVEYWSLEQAKIKKKKKLLEGNVVVITGSTGTIGFETYKMFKSYGAEVVLLDYNSDRLKNLQSKINELCIHCDVRNKKSVKNAFNQICEKYGGIDILISNAGTATSGAIGEVNDDILRQSFEENFFSHQNCASEAIKIMKKQNINGCLLFNISKQYVNPGKNFGPYGLPKSALLSLCKQYAVDYGSYGIRSNGVNADRIRSGLMNNKMIRTRAKARSISTDDYMRGNLLLNEVKAEDVAKAFFHLATSKKTTGAVLAVDGGNIAASLR